MPSYFSHQVNGALDSLDIKQVLNKFKSRFFLGYKKKTCGVILNPANIRHQSQTLTELSNNDSNKIHLIAYSDVFIINITTCIQLLSRCVS